LHTPSMIYANVVGQASPVFTRAGSPVYEFDLYKIDWFIVNNQLVIGRGRPCVFIGRGRPCVYPP